jgi:uncharacterized protein YjbI with pentapeptide repeats
LVFEFSWMSQQGRHHQQQVITKNECSKKNGKRKALIIAVSDYDKRSSLRPLPFCKKDGEGIHSVLKKQGYKIPNEWKLIGRVEGKTIKDAIFEFFRKSAGSDDTLLFYFSGHGVYDSFGDHYLASSDIDRKIMDENGYNFQDLENHTKKSDAKNIITILDCCFSGAARAGKSGSAKPAEKARGVMNDLFEEGSGRCVFASSLDVQSSYPMKGGEYSRFTNFLLEGLKGGNGDAVNEHGYVTPSKLSNYIYQNIPLLKQQKPITKTAMSGDIIIARYSDLAKRDKMSQEDYLLQLLKEEEIDEFNEIRSRYYYSKQDFFNVDLSGRDLSYADMRHFDLYSPNLRKAKLRGAGFRQASLISGQLEYADLSGAELLGADLLGSDFSNADLSNATLSSASLSVANLSHANLSRADFSNAYLYEADLSNANLSRADLSHANLSHANLSHANLSHANLSHANLAHSIIIGVKLVVKDDNKKHYPQCKNARLNNSTIIDDEGLCRHFHNSNARNVPPAAKNKKELREKLKKRGFDKYDIDRYLSISSLAGSSR